jgi:U3 small nucleolar RNA-associated protein 23
VITQCCIRHLYGEKPQQHAVIDLAKTFERRRCNHHELENPLSTLECLSAVVNPKDDQTNKHRYVIASQDQDVRAYFRRIPGVPQVYISRSVMILEPISGASDKVSNAEERKKLRAGLKPKSRASLLGKRNRDDESGDEKKENGNTDNQPSKKKRAKGPKGPNPLSVLKPKRRAHDGNQRLREPNGDSHNQDNAETNDAGAEKKKRRRKSSKRAEDGESGEQPDGVAASE